MDDFFCVIFGIVQFHRRGVFFPNMIMIVFIAVGIALMVAGIKKIIRDKKTDLYGEINYALITDVKYNGKSSNGARYYDAYAKVYIESEDRFVEASDDIGKDPNLYPVNSYVAVRYYEGDINFEYAVPSFEGLPLHIREKFDDGQIIPDDMQYGTENSYENASNNAYNPNNMYNYDYELK